MELHFLNRMEPGHIICLHNILMHRLHPLYTVLVPLCIILCIVHACTYVLCRFSQDSTLYHHGYTCYGVYHDIVYLVYGVFLMKGYYVSVLVCVHTMHVFMYYVCVYTCSYSIMPVSVCECVCVCVCGKKCIDHTPCLHLSHSICTATVNQVTSCDINESYPLMREYLDVWSVE